MNGLNQIKHNSLDTNSNIFLMTQNMHCIRPYGETNDMNWFRCDGMDFSYHFILLAQKNTRIPINPISIRMPNVFFLYNFFCVQNNNIPHTHIFLCYLSVKSSELKFTEPSESMDFNYQTSEDWAGQLICEIVRREHFQPDRHDIWMWEGESMSQTRK